MTSDGWSFWLRFFERAKIEEKAVGLEVGGTETVTDMGL